MARVTVEDCLKEGDSNRFRLILAASKRARQLADGHAPLVEMKNDKPTVLALREIEESKTTISDLLAGAFDHLPRMEKQPQHLIMPLNNEDE